MVNWLDQAWQYRKSHNITGSTAGAQTDYQVGIKVYYSGQTDGTEVVNGTTFGKVSCGGNCKSDFGDIRFTNADGTSQLSYWIQTYSSSSYAIIWVKVPSIPTSPSIQTIYMYYGNSAASTTSNIGSTFLFGDDFSSSTETLTFNSGGGTWTRDTTNKRLSYTGAGTHGKAIREAGITNGRILTQLCVAGTFSGNMKTTLIARGDSTATYGYHSLLSEANVLRWACSFGSWIPFGTNQNGLTLTSSWSDFEAHVTGNSFSSTLNGSTVTGNDSTNSTNTYWGVYAYTPSTSYTMYYNFIAIARYVSPEPAHTSWGPQAAANDLEVGNLIVNGYETVASTLTVGGIINSQALGSFPVAGSNAGMILDWYNSSHRNGLGIQLGGIWLKYADEFDVYRDSGNSLIRAFHLDEKGNHIFYDTGNYLYWDGNQQWIQNQTPPSEDNYIYVFASTRSPYNPWGSPADAPLLYVSQSLFVENDICTFGVLSTLSDPQKVNGGRGGGGALVMGHGYTGLSDMPIILLADAQSTFDTIWLKARPPANPPKPLAPDWPWGSLELQNVIAHGSISIFGYSTMGVTGYGYLSSNGTHGYMSGSSGNVNISLRTDYRIFCGGEIDVFSDQRDKNLIDNLNAQTALDAVTKLNPLHFVWKPETKKGNNVVAGFFAQEVAQVIPEAVTVHKGARYIDEHTLNYNVLTTYALSAIQALSLKRNKDIVKMDALSKEISELRLKLQQLTS